MVMGRQRTSATIRPAVLMLTFGLAVGGCSSEARTEPTAMPSLTSEDLTKGLDTSHEFEAHVTAIATGAAAFTWEGRETLVVTRIGGTRDPTNLLTVGFAYPQIIPADRRKRFRWAVDLLDAYQDQPATFTLNGNAVKEGGMASQAMLIWMRVTDPGLTEVNEWRHVAYYKEFTKPTRPCAVTIGPDERNGTLKYPALADKDGAVTSLTITWEAIGPSTSTAGQ